jgi:hypothetical protein
MIRAPNFTHGAGVWQHPVGATVWRQKYIGTTGSVIGQHQEKHTAVNRQTKLLFVNNCRTKIIGAEDSFSYSQNLSSGPILLLPAERNRVSKTITPSVSFYLSLDSAKLHYPTTNKKKRREYMFR